MSVKKKYYAVAVGRSPGIYEDWPSAESQVKGYAGARYKGFADCGEAEAWLADPRIERRAGASPAPAAPPPPVARPGALIVHSDGGCIDNPGPGGYGVVIESDGERRELSGGFRRTTNNRMELLAVVVALEELRQCARPIDIYCDSSYVINGIDKGWARAWRQRGWRRADGGAVANVDLWARLLDLVARLDVRFCWVKGHAGHVENECCDVLAGLAARGADLPEDEGFVDGQGVGKS